MDDQSGCPDVRRFHFGAQIARAICDFQHKSTGHTSTAMSVILNEDTLVITANNRVGVR